jgi:hypothetical protein
MIALVGWIVAFHPGAGITVAHPILASVVTWNVLVVVRAGAVFTNSIGCITAHGIGIHTLIVRRRVANYLGSRADPAFTGVVSGAGVPVVAGLSIVEGVIAYTIAAGSSG